MDNNPAWLPGVPFRFMDLPPEMRRLVYKQLFKPALLAPKPNCGCSLHTGGLPTAEKQKPGDITNYSSGTIPGLLSVCRAVRAEALPTFEQSINLIFCPVLDAVDAMPQRYLTCARSAILGWDREVRVDEVRMPNLRTLHVYTGQVEQEWDLWIPNDSEFADLLVEDFEHLRDTRCFDGLDERLKEGMPPFEIFITGGLADVMRNEDGKATSIASPPHLRCKRTLQY